MSKRDAVIAGAAIGGLTYLATAGALRLLTSPFRAINRQLTQPNTVIQNWSRQEEVTISHYREEPQLRQPKRSKTIDMGKAVEIAPYDEFDINNMVQGDRVLKQQQQERARQQAEYQAGWNRHASTRAELQQILAPQKKKFLGIF